MTDRLVRKYNPSTHALAPPSWFSDHLHERNIVLLGDPGAGKSHLFGSFAGANELRTARDLLNIPVAALPKSTLFIDGLDEKRTGRGDHTAVDALVTKLFEVEATHVRVACRVADWLGSTDAWRRIDPRARSHVRDGNRANASHDRLRAARGFREGSAVAWTG